MLFLDGMALWRPKRESKETNLCRLIEHADYGDRRRCLLLPGQDSWLGMKEAVDLRKTKG